ncbi:hypothetical protein LCGC14_1012900 [marine sediment metagenome]|uniref:Cytidyltransferase-like domain-containing protein n=1 Tax=marine sediment metagenome TaxID=412755 RepID=A0A0F9QI36_9ZZZZ
MNTVMVTGHFDPFHDGHLDYLKQARELGGFLFCVVSTDKQLMIKKGNVNIPEEGRREIVRLILQGMGVKNIVFLNIFDVDTTSVANVIRMFKTDIFFRGGDKKLEDMPAKEKKICEELGIEIRHAKMNYPTHGAGMVL